VRTLVFDDIEIAPAVSVTALPVDGTLSDHLLQLMLTNKDVRPASGTLRLTLKGQTVTIGQAKFANLKPGQNQTVSLRINGSRPGSEWPIIAEVDLTDGSKTTNSFNVDFAAATQCKTPPALDGDLSDWGDALPLHIDRDEYTLGSYGNNWSPEDESATTWAKWDDHYFYFAALVHDQLFNQNMHGFSIWMQDSIQVGLFPDADGGPYSEFGLAKTPQGEEVFQYCLAGNWQSADAEGAKLKVVLSQGQAIYEAAIPWSAIPGAKPAVGATMRYDVLLNDDDVIVPRRFMSRYGNSIVMSKDVKDYGYLHLIGPPEGHD
jgi:hypothetical protein